LPCRSCEGGAWFCVKPASPVACGLAALVTTQQFIDSFVRNPLINIILLAKTLLCPPERHKDA